MRRLAVLLVLAGILSSCGIPKIANPFRGGSSARTVAQRAYPAVPAIVVMDASGSMKAEDAPGERFAAATSAVESLVKALPDGHRLGLLAYGTGAGNSQADRPAGCRDIRTVVRLGKLDRKSFVAKLDALRPRGWTPIGSSLQAAAKALPSKGRRAIVLVSDGEDTCAPTYGTDPCQVAKSLHQDNPDLSIYTVGFKTSDDQAAQRQLACIAEAGGGLDLDAGNSAQLQSRLAAAFTPGATRSALLPDGYLGLRPGMTVAQARAAAPKLGSVTASGRVEIVYVHCTLVFDDGILTEIRSKGRSLRTVDGVKVGTDISVAEKLYGISGVPSVARDGTVTYVADAGNGTGYRITYSPKSGELKGPITKIVLCDCAPSTVINYVGRGAEYGVEIKSSSDVDKLVGAPTSFKEFIGRLITHELATQPSPDCNTSVSIERVDVRGLATGSVLSCGGYATIWSTRDGKWKETYGWQEDLAACPSSFDSDFSVTAVLEFQPGACIQAASAPFASQLASSDGFPSDYDGYESFQVDGGALGCDIYDALGVGVGDGVWPAYRCTMHGSAVLSRSKINSGDLAPSADADDLDCFSELASQSGGKPALWCRGGVEGDYELSQGTGKTPATLESGQTLSFRGVRCAFESPILSCRVPSTGHGFEYSVTGWHRFF